MKAFLKLIRWQNLMIVALTMVLMRYAVIAPLINKISVTLIKGNGSLPMTVQFPWYDFILLVTATILLTAGGYVINDYFDIKTDLINKGKVIVGTKIPRRQAMMWHNIFNVLGVVIGFYISWKAGYLMMGALFLLVSGLLYFYSASYKRQFLIGNIIVAILTAMVPLLVVFYEWPALYRFYRINAVSMPDIAYGRNTVPVVIGVLSAKVVSICLIFITIVLLYLTWYFFINDIITLIYVSAVVVLPLLFVVYKVVVSSSRSQLHNASSIMKIVMLTGILYSVVVKIILTWNLY
jgi:4-hydroxybenzoate polyprenyltransferase